MDKRVLVVGSGFVGRAIFYALRGNVKNVILTGSRCYRYPEKSFLKILKANRPDVVINAAGKANASWCEKKPEEAKRANQLMPAHLFKKLSEFNPNALFVHISTCHVFASARGDSTHGWNEKSDPFSFTERKMSVYTRTKMLGERRIKHVSDSNQHCKWWIVRLTNMYGGSSSGFLENSIHAIREGKKVSAIYDQYIQPTLVSDAAVRIAQMLKEENRWDCGIYHIFNSGDPETYENIVRQIVRLLGLEDRHLINLVSAEDVLDVPFGSGPILSNSKLPRMRPWHLALKEYIEKTHKK